MLKECGTGTWETDTCPRGWSQGQEAAPHFQACVIDGAASLPPQGRELRCPFLVVGSNMMQTFLVVSAKAVGSAETNK